MYIIYTLFITIIASWNCGIIPGNKTSDTIPINKKDYQNDTFFKSVYFSQSDAEQVLGEKAHISDSSSTINKDTLEIKLAYTADNKELKTGKTGVIYFMLEEYSNDSATLKVYTAIKVANEKHEGVKVVHDMGDDAYFHSDERNFYFILVRKGKKLLRLKVNKITSYTSLNDFYKVAKKISEVL